MLRVFVELKFGMFPLLPLITYEKGIPEYFLSLLTLHLFLPYICE